ncbi:MAG: hypothetical protein NDP22_01020 [Crenarchaeota archaeon]|nr:hypothetical protein [Thermoproteota archaeon]
MKIASPTTLARVVANISHTIYVKKPEPEFRGEIYRNSFSKHMCLITAIMLDWIVEQYS